MLSNAADEKKRPLTIARLLAVAVKALLFFFPEPHLEPEYSELTESVYLEYCTFLHYKNVFFHGQKWY